MKPTPKDTIKQINRELRILSPGVGKAEPEAMGIKTSTEPAPKDQNFFSKILYRTSETINNLLNPATENRTVLHDYKDQTISLFTKPITDITNRINPTDENGAATTTTFSGLIMAALTGVCTAIFYAGSILIGFGIITLYDGIIAAIGFGIVAVGLVLAAVGHYGKEATFNLFKTSEPKTLEKTTTKKIDTESAVFDLYKLPYTGIILGMVVSLSTYLTSLYTTAFPTGYEVGFIIAVLSAMTSAAMKGGIRASIITGGIGTALVLGFMFILGPALAAQTILPIALTTAAYYILLVPVTLYAAAELTTNRGGIQTTTKRGDDNAYTSIGATLAVGAIIGLGIAIYVSLTAGLIGTSLLAAIFAFLIIYTLTDPTTVQDMELGTKIFGAMLFIYGATTIVLYEVAGKGLLTAGLFEILNNASLGLGIITIITGTINLLFGKEFIIKIKDLLLGTSSKQATVETTTQPLFSLVAGFRAKIILSTAVGLVSAALLALGIAPTLTLIFGVLMFISFLANWFMLKPERSWSRVHADSYLDMVYGPRVSLDGYIRIPRRVLYDHAYIEQGHSGGASGGIIFSSFVAGAVVSAAGFFVLGLQAIPALAVGYGLGSILLIALSLSQREKLIKARAEAEEFIAELDNPLTSSKPVTNMQEGIENWSKIAGKYSSLALSEAERIINLRSFELSGNPTQENISNYFKLLSTVSLHGGISYTTEEDGSFLGAMHYTSEKNYTKLERLLAGTLEMIGEDAFEKTYGFDGSKLLTDIRSRIQGEATKDRDGGQLDILSSTVISTLVLGAIGIAVLGYTLFTLPLVPWLVFFGGYALVTYFTYSRFRSLNNYEGIEARTKFAILTLISLMSGLLLGALLAAWMGPVSLILTQPLVVEFILVTSVFTNYVISGTNRRLNMPRKDTTKALNAAAKEPVFLFNADDMPTEAINQALRAGEKHLKDIIGVRDRKYDSVIRKTSTYLFFKKQQEAQGTPVPELASALTPGEQALWNWMGKELNVHLNELEKGINPIFDNALEEYKNKADRKKASPESAVSSLGVGIALAFAAVVSYASFILLSTPLALISGPVILAYAYYMYIFRAPYYDISYDIAGFPNLGTNHLRSRRWDFLSLHIIAPLIFSAGIITLTSPITFLTLPIVLVLSAIIELVVSGFNPMNDSAVSDNTKLVLLTGVVAVIAGLLFFPGTVAGLIAAAAAYQGAAVALIGLAAVAFLVLGRKGSSQQNSFLRANLDSLKIPFNVGNNILTDILWLVGLVLGPFFTFMGAWTILTAGIPGIFLTALGAGILFLDWRYYKADRAYKLNKRLSRYADNRGLKVEDLRTQYGQDITPEEIDRLKTSGKQKYGDNSAVSDTQILPVLFGITAVIAAGFAFMVGLPSYLIPGLSSVVPVAATESAWFADMAVVIPAVISACLINFLIFAVTPTHLTRKITAVGAFTIPMLVTSIAMGLSGLFTWGQAISICGGTIGASTIVVTMGWLLFRQGTSDKTIGKADDTVSDENERAAIEPWVSALVIPGIVLAGLGAVLLFTSALSNPVILLLFGVAVVVVGWSVYQDREIRSPDAIRTLPQKSALSDFLNGHKNSTDKVIYISLCISALCGVYLFITGLIAGGAGMLAALFGVGIIAVDIRLIDRYNEFKKIMSPKNQAAVDKFTSTLGQDLSLQEAYDIMSAMGVKPERVDDYLVRFYDTPSSQQDGATVVAELVLAIKDATDEGYSLEEIKSLLGEQIDTYLAKEPGVIKLHDKTVINDINNLIEQKKAWINLPILPEVTLPGAPKVYNINQLKILDKEAGTQIVLAYKGNVALTYSPLNVEKDEVKVYGYIGGAIVFEANYLKVDKVGWTMRGFNLNRKLSNKESVRINKLFEATKKSSEFLETLRNTIPQEIQKKLGSINVFMNGLSAVTDPVVRARLSPENDRVMKSDSENGNYANIFANSVVPAINRIQPDTADRITPTLVHLSLTNPEYLQSLVENPHLATESPKELFSQGYAALLEGRYEDAEERYEQLSIRHELNFTAFVGLGYSYFMLGRYDAAEAWFQKVLDSSKENPTALLGSIVSRSEGKSDKIEAFKQTTLEYLKPKTRNAPTSVEAAQTRRIGIFTILDVTEAELKDIREFLIGLNNGKDMPIPLEIDGESIKASVSLHSVFNLVRRRIESMGFEEENRIRNDSTYQRFFARYEKEYWIEPLTRTVSTPAEALSGEEYRKSILNSGRYLDLEEKLSFLSHSLSKNGSKEARRLNEELNARKDDLIVSISRIPLYDIKQSRNIPVLIGFFTKISELQDNELGDITADKIISILDGGLPAIKEYNEKHKQTREVGAGKSALDRFRDDIGSELSLEKAYEALEKVGISRKQANDYMEKYQGTPDSQLDGASVVAELVLAVRGAELKGYALGEIKDLFGEKINAYINKEPGVLKIDATTVTDEIKRLAYKTPSHVTKVSELGVELLIPKAEAGRYFDFLDELDFRTGIPLDYYAEKEGENTRIVIHYINTLFNVVDEIAISDNPNVRTGFDSKTFLAEFIKAKEHPVYLEIKTAYEKQYGAKTQSRSGMRNDEATYFGIEGIANALGKQDKKKTPLELYGEAMRIIPHDYEKLFSTIEGLRINRDKALIFKEVLAPVFAKYVEGMKPADATGVFNLNKAMLLELLNNRRAAEEWAESEIKRIDETKKHAETIPAVVDSEERLEALKALREADGKIRKLEAELRTLENEIKQVSQYIQGPRLKEYTKGYTDRVQVLASDLNTLHTERRRLEAIINPQQTQTTPAADNSENRYTALKAFKRVEKKISQLRDESTILQSNLKYLGGRLKGQGLVKFTQDYEKRSKEIDSELTALYAERDALQNGDVGFVVAANLLDRFSELSLGLDVNGIRDLSIFGAKVVSEANTALNNQVTGENKEQAVRAAFQDALNKQTIPENLKDALTNHRNEILNEIIAVGQGGLQVLVDIKLRKLKAYPRVYDFIRENYKETVGRFTGYFQGDKTFHIIPVNLMLIEEFGEDVFLRFLEKDKENKKWAFQGYQDLMWHLIDSEKDYKGKSKYAIEQMIKALGIPKDALGEVLVENPEELKRVITILEDYDKVSHILQALRNDANMLLHEEGAGTTRAEEKKAHERYVQLFQKKPYQAVAGLRALIKSDDEQLSGLRNIKKTYGLKQFTEFLASDAHSLFKQAAIKAAQKDASKLSALFALSEIDANIFDGFAGIRNAAEKPSVLDYLNMNQNELVTWFAANRDIEHLDTIVSSFYELEDYEVRRLDKEFLNRLLENKANASAFEANPLGYFLTHARKRQEQAEFVLEPDSGLQNTIARNIEKKFFKNGIYKEVTSEGLREICGYGVHAVDLAGQFVTETDDATRTREAVIEAMLQLGMPESMETLSEKDLETIILTFASVTQGGLLPAQSEMESQLLAFFNDKLYNEHDGVGVGITLFNKFVSMPDSETEPEKRKLAEEVAGDMVRYNIKVYLEDPQNPAPTNRGFVDWLKEQGEWGRKKIEIWNEWLNREENDEYPLNVKDFISHSDVERVMGITGNTQVDEVMRILAPKRSIEATTSPAASETKPNDSFVVDQIRPGFAELGITSEEVLEKLAALVLELQKQSNDAGHKQNGVDKTINAELKKLKLPTKQWPMVRTKLKAYAASGWMPFGYNKNALGERGAVDFKPVVDATTRIKQQSNGARPMDANIPPMNKIGWAPERLKNNARDRAPKVHNHKAAQEDLQAKLSKLQDTTHDAKKKGPRDLSGFYNSFSREIEKLSEEAESGNISDLKSKFTDLRERITEARRYKTKSEQLNDLLEQVNALLSETVVPPASYTEEEFDGLRNPPTLSAEENLQNQVKNLEELALAYIKEESFLKAADALEKAIGAITSPERRSVDERKYLELRSGQTLLLIEHLRRTGDETIKDSIILLLGELKLGRNKQLKAPAKTENIFSSTIERIESGRYIEALQRMAPSVDKKWKDFISKLPDESIEPLGIKPEQLKETTTPEQKRPRYLETGFTMGFNNRRDCDDFTKLLKECDITDYTKHETSIYVAPKQARIFLAQIQENIDNLRSYFPLVLSDEQLNLIKQAGGVLIECIEGWRTIPMKPQMLNLDVSSLRRGIYQAGSDKPQALAVDYPSWEAKALIPMFESLQRGNTNIFCTRLAVETRDLSDKYVYLGSTRIIEIYDHMHNSWSDVDSRLIKKLTSVKDGTAVILEVPEGPKKGERFVLIKREGEDTLFTPISKEATDAELESAVKKLVGDRAVPYTEADEVRSIGIKGIIDEDSVSVVARLVLTMLNSGREEANLAAFFLFRSMLRSDEPRFMAVLNEALSNPDLWGKYTLEYVKPEVDKILSMSRKTDENAFWERLFTVHGAYVNWVWYSTALDLITAETKEKIENTYKYSPSMNRDEWFSWELLNELSSELRQAGIRHILGTVFSHGTHIVIPLIEDQNKLRKAMRENPEKYVRYTPLLAQAFEENDLPKMKVEESSKAVEISRREDLKAACYAILDLQRTVTKKYHENISLLTPLTGELKQLAELFTGDEPVIYARVFRGDTIYVKWSGKDWMKTQYGQETYPNNDKTIPAQMHLIELGKTFDPRWKMSKFAFSTPAGTYIITSKNYLGGKTELSVVKQAKSDKKITYPGRVITKEDAETMVNALEGLLEWKPIYGPEKRFADLIKENLNIVPNNDGTAVFWGFEDVIRMPLSGDPRYIDRAGVRIQTEGKAIIIDTSIGRIKVAEENKNIKVLGIQEIGAEEERPRIFDSSLKLEDPVKSMNAFGFGQLENPFKARGITHIAETNTTYSMDSASSILTIKSSSDEVTRIKEFLDSLDFGLYNGPYQSVDGMRRIIISLGKLRRALKEITVIKTLDGQLTIQVTTHPVYRQHFAKYAEGISHPSGFVSPHTFASMIGSDVNAAVSVVQRDYNGILPEASERRNHFLRTVEELKSERLLQRFLSELDKRGGLLNLGLSIREIEEELGYEALIQTEDCPNDKAGELIDIFDQSRSELTELFGVDVTVERDRKHKDRKLFIGKTKAAEIYGNQNSEWSSISPAIKKVSSIRDGIAVVVTVQEGPKTGQRFLVTKNIIKPINSDAKEKDLPGIRLEGTRQIDIDAVKEVLEPICKGYNLWKPEDNAYKTLFRQLGERLTKAKYTGIKTTNELRGVLSGVAAPEKIKKLFSNNNPDYNQHILPGFLALVLSAPKNLKTSRDMFVITGSVDEINSLTRFLGNIGYDYPLQRIGTEGGLVEAWVAPEMVYMKVLEKMRSDNPYLFSLKVENRISPIEHPIYHNYFAPFEQEYTGNQIKQTKDKPSETTPKTSGTYRVDKFEQGTPFADEINFAKRTGKDYPTKAVPQETTYTEHIGEGSVEIKSSAEEIRKIKGFLDSIDQNLYYGSYIGGILGRIVVFTDKLSKTASEKAKGDEIYITHFAHPIGGGVAPYSSIEAIKTLDARKILENENNTGVAIALSLFATRIASIRDKNEKTVGLGQAASSVLSDMLRVDESAAKRLFRNAMEKSAKDDRDKIALITAELIDYVRLTTAPVKVGESEWQGILMAPNGEPASNVSGNILHNISSVEDARWAIRVLNQVSTGKVSSGLNHLKEFMESSRVTYKIIDSSYLINYKGDIWVACAPLQGKYYVNPIVQPKLGITYNSDREPTLTLRNLENSYQITLDGDNVKVTPTPSLQGEELNVRPTRGVTKPKAEKGSALEEAKRRAQQNIKNGSGRADGLTYSGLINDVSEKSGWVIPARTPSGLLMLGLLPYREGADIANTPIRRIIQDAIDVKNAWVADQTSSGEFKKASGIRERATMESLYGVARGLTEAQMIDIENKVEVITSGSQNLTGFTQLHKQFVEEYAKYFAPNEDIGNTKYSSQIGEPCAVDYNDPGKYGAMYAQAAEYSGSDVSADMRRRMNAVMNLYALLMHEMIETVGRERANYYYYGKEVQNVTKYCELGEGIAIYFAAKMMEEGYNIKYADAVNLIYAQQLFGFDSAGAEYAGQLEAVRTLVEDSKIDPKTLLNELLSWSLEARQIPVASLTPYLVGELESDLKEYADLKVRKGDELLGNEELLPTEAILRALTTFKVYGKETDKKKATLAKSSLEFLYDMMTTFDGKDKEGPVKKVMDFWVKIMPG